MRLLLLLSAALAIHAETVKQGSALKVHAPAAAVSARLNDRTIRLFPEPGGTTFGLMPIAIDAKPGAYTLDLLDKSGAAIQTVPVQVLDAHFRKQNVAMAESTAALKPSPGEVETTAAFRNTVSDTRYWTEPFELPVRGCMTSPFGVQRYLNGKPTGAAHAGLDQRSPAGAPIHAIAAGVVRFVQEWNLHGRTVAIDHGQGLESIYLHMSKTAATEGQHVNKGDIIGYVGTTGRSTAPHLHWTIYANSIPVNPLDWVNVAPCAPPSAAKSKKKR